MTNTSLTIPASAPDDLAAYSINTDAPTERGRAIWRLHKIYDSALTEGDNPTALSAVKELSKLLNLYAIPTDTGMLPRAQVEEGWRTFLGVIEEVLKDAIEEAVPKVAPKRGPRMSHKLARKRLTEVFGNVVSQAMEAKDEGGIE